MGYFDIIVNKLSIAIMITKMYAKFKCFFCKHDTLVINYRISDFDCFFKTPVNLYFFAF